MLYVQGLWQYLVCGNNSFHVSIIVALEGQLGQLELTDVVKQGFSVCRLCSVRPEGHKLDISISVWK